MTHLIVLLVILAILLAKIPQRLLHRRCIMCGISTSDPILFDRRYFDTENCRALYEADRDRTYERWWAEQNKDLFGF